MGCGASSISFEPEPTVSGGYQRNEIKLLLLGAENSGKSTVFKQLKMMHEEGYTPKEWQHYRQIVCANTIQNLKDILLGMHKLRIDFADNSRIQDEYTFLKLTESYGEKDLGKGLLKFMKRLWEDEGVQICLSRSSEYHLNDSASYFLHCLDRIGCADYIPNKEDVLRTRVKTSGIIVNKVTFHDLHLKIYDFGGCRAERKKWFLCFNDAAVIIFCVALSGYDLMLDDETHRSMTQLEESIILFDNICNNVAFAQTSIILFLNKKDVFKNKIKRIPLSICFPEYDGSHLYEECADFVRKKFENISQRAKGTEICTHLTSAIDAADIEVTFKIVTDIINKNNVKTCELV